jgi:hypothetical protein
VVELYADAISAVVNGQSSQKAIQALREKDAG